MSTTAIPVSGADISCEIADRCRVYKDKFGFDVVPDPDTGVIRLTTTSVSGVMTTPALGRAVLDSLETVPAFSVDYRGHRLWVLLADAPTSRDDVEHPALSLLKYAVLLVFPQASIALPTPGDSRRVWLRTPQDRTRVPLSVLVDAIVDAAGSGSDFLPEPKVKGGDDE